MIHDIITPGTLAPSSHTRAAREVIQADYAHTQLLHILAQSFDLRDPPPSQSPVSINVADAVD